VAGAGVIGASPRLLSSLPPAQPSSGSRQGRSSRL
jgi:hypothetical protein